jgi:hypothetical protein
MLIGQPVNHSLSYHHDKFRPLDQVYIDSAKLIVKSFLIMFFAASFRTNAVYCTQATEEAQNGREGRYRLNENKKMC